MIVLFNHVSDRHYSSSIAVQIFHKIPEEWASRKGICCIVRNAAKIKLADIPHCDDISLYALVRRRTDTELRC